MQKVSCHSVAAELTLCSSRVQPVHNALLVLPQQCWVCINGNNLHPQGCTDDASCASSCNKAFIYLIESDPDGEGWGACMVCHYSKGLLQVLLLHCRCDSVIVACVTIPGGGVAARCCIVSIAPVGPDWRGDILQPAVCISGTS